MYVDRDGLRAALPIHAIALAILAPLSFVTLAALVASFFWLFYLGVWQLPVIGIIAGAFGTQIFSIPMIPIFGLGFAANNRLKASDRASAHVLTVLANIWTCLIIFGVCAAALYVAYRFKNPDSPIYPYILWAYATATLQYNRMADEASEVSPPSVVGAVAAQAAIISAIAAILYVADDPVTIAIALIVPILFGLILLVVVSAFAIDSAASHGESLTMSGHFRRRRHIWGLSGIIAAATLAFVLYSSEARERLVPVMPYFWSWAASTSAGVRQNPESRSAPDVDPRPRLNADDQCADWDHALKHRYMDACYAARARNTVPN